MSAFNHHLRAARCAHSTGVPWSRMELARAVNVWIEATTGHPSHIDALYLARLERGYAPWPDSTRREALRTLLGVRSDADLGFTTAGEEPSPP